MPIIECSELSKKSHSVTDENERTYGKSECVTTAICENERQWKLKKTDLVCSCQKNSCEGDTAGFFRRLFLIMKKRDSIRDNMQLICKSTYASMCPCFNTTIECVFGFSDPFNTFSHFFTKWVDNQ